LGGERVRKKGEKKRKEETALGPLRKRQENLTKSTGAKKGKRAKNASEEKGTFELMRRRLPWGGVTGRKAIKGDGPMHEGRGRERGLLGKKEKRIMRGGG